jgi:thiamine-monophosphate kinase
VGDLGEFGWITRLARRAARGPSVLCGLGDDAAVLRLRSPTLVTTDALIEGIHFRRGWGTSRQLGYRAFAVNASDIAAMGGRATHAVLDLRVPPSVPVSFLDDLYRGFRRAAHREGALLVGGNTSRDTKLSVGVTLLGWAPHGHVTRSGCVVGDDLYVTGTLGLAAVGRRALQRGHGSARATSVRRFLLPPIRGPVARALVRTGLVGGMIDVSDGCLQDLRHLCDASRVGAVLELERLPLSRAYRRTCGADARVALGGGEDYELLFSARPSLAPRLGSLARRWRCPVSRIGRIVPARRGVQVVDRRGRALPLGPVGYDHFR